MIFERLYPSPAERIDGDDRALLLDAYRPPRTDWLRINLIASVTGSATGVDGTSETLSSRPDRRILGVIRELADVVVVGAASVRTEGYQHPRHSRLAVVTVSGNLAGHRLDAPEGAAPIVICPPAAAARVRAQIPGAEILELAPTGRTIAATEVIGVLRDRGFASIVCEGGPSLAGQLLDAGVVDELSLSTSPRVGGTQLALTGPAVISERTVSLHQLLCDEASGLYARWTL